MLLTLSGHQESSVYGVLCNSMLTVLILWVNFIIFELCMLLGKLLCIKFLNWIMMLICSILNIVLVFCL